MKALLQQYLVEHQTVALPGIGVLQALALPASYDVADRLFQAPSVQLDFVPYEQGESSPVQHLVGVIAIKKNVTEEEAYSLLQQYAQGAKEQLILHGKWAWSPLGNFELQEENAITFQSSEITTGFLAISADRVIREGASHEMLVGDTATTNIKMEALLAETEEATDRWWLLPLLLALAAIALIVWHFAAS